MALAISGDSGGPAAQANTQSPQTSAGPGGPPTTQGKSVQPGTADDLLKGSGGGSEGIPLSSTELPVANLNTSAQTSTTTAKPTHATKTQHHPNAVLLVIVVALVVLALATLWLTSRSAKNTTNY